MLGKVKLVELTPHIAKSELLRTGKELKPLVHQVSNYSKIKSPETHGISPIP
jgi:hypothetical protein